MNKAEFPENNRLVITCFRIEGVHIYSSRWQLNQEETPEGREDLRNSINREPIYEWEGSQRDSLGAITYVTKVRLQHLPCQVLILNESLPVYRHIKRNTPHLIIRVSKLWGLFTLSLNPGDSSRFGIVQHAHYLTVTQ